LAVAMPFDEDDAVEDAGEVEVVTPGDDDALGMLGVLYGLGDDAC
jgi:hypothetical protein